MCLQVLDLQSAFNMQSRKHVVVYNHSKDLKYIAWSWRGFSYKELGYHSQELIHRLQKFD